jgi:hypothetical protein
MVYGSVLGLFVYFDLRMIRAKMALPARLGLSRFREGKFVPGMAARTASPAAVRIYSADTYVRPRIGTECSIFYFHDAAVAVVAARLPLDAVIHAVIQPWIYLPNQLEGIGMFAPSILCGLSRVAS